MDYEAEQASELEALDSIYCGDMEILERSPCKFRIPIKSEGCEAGEDGPACSLVFTYTPCYPDQLPDVEVEDAVNFHHVDEEELVKHLLQQGEENLGMVMVFTLVSAGQEWLNGKYDAVKRTREEGARAKLRREEEAEQKRFEGTRVSVETFLVWRKHFEVETGVAARRERDAKDPKKLTGRELFLRDTTLNQSDLKFLDDGDAVKVDESLFQELDDLELTDEDDEDYVPGASDSD